MPAIADIQRQHQNMSVDQWALSFSPRSASPKKTFEPQTKAETLQQVTNRVAETVVAAPTETGTARLFGMTPDYFAQGFKSITPEAQKCREIIEQMKQEFDAMEAKIHIVTPLPEVKSKTTEKTASQGCILLSALCAIGRGIAAVARIIFCCGLSSGTKTKDKPKYAPEVQEYLKTFREMLNDNKEFMKMVKANLPTVSDVEAVEQVHSNFKAYVLANLNYTQD